MKWTTNSGLELTFHVAACGVRNDSGRRGKGGSGVALPERFEFLGVRGRLAGPIGVNDGVESSLCFEIQLVMCDMAAGLRGGCFSWVICGAGKENCDVSLGIWWWMRKVRFAISESWLRSYSNYQRGFKASACLERELSKILIDHDDMEVGVGDKEPTSRFREGFLT